MKSATRFKTGVTVSAVGHVVVLGWGLISFNATRHEAKYEETLVVDVISDSALNQATAGARNAKQAEQPKQKVEKIAEPKPAENEATKVVENKPEIQAAVDEPTPPKPEPEKKPEPKKPEPKEAKVEVPVPEPRPEPKPEPKVDQIAEALKKEEKKKPEPEKKPEPKPQAKEEPKKKPEPKFDPANIQKRLALIDKREPQRRAATGEALSQTASLGTARGTALRNAMNWAGALKARMSQCWSPPVGVAEARGLEIVIRLKFKRDGSLAGNPRVINNSNHPAFTVAAESALRAIHQCAPFTFLPPDQYDGEGGWGAEVEIGFDPSEMFRG